MIKSVSYYLRYKKFGEITYSFEDVKTLKQLKKVVRKFIDLGITFEVWVKFNFKKELKKFNYGFSDYTSFEIWMYDAITDKVFSYNLRKNMYYKALRRYERKLRPIMLNHSAVKV